MAKCPHCDQPLSTYTTTLDDGDNPNVIKVLVCAQCDKLLGVVGEV
jgi:phage FluMu protein Com